MATVTQYVSVYRDGILYDAAHARARGRACCRGDRSVTDLPAPVRAALADLPCSPNGWWHASDGEQYETLAAELLLLGIGEDTVIDVLSRAYAAAANEFGG